MSSFQYKVSNNFKSYYKNKNVKDIPISIITTNIDNYYPNNIIINNFEDIEDLINYCVCSSYIPYICGNKFYKEYKNKKYIDGAILINNKNINNNPSIYLHRDIWDRKFTLSDRTILNYKNSEKLFNYGVLDASNNIKKLLN